MTCLETNDGPATNCEINPSSSLASVLKAEIGSNMIIKTNIAEVNRIISFLLQFLIAYIKIKNGMNNRDSNRTNELIATQVNVRKIIFQDSNLKFLLKSLNDSI